MTVSGSANYLYEDQVFPFMNQIVTRMTLQLTWVVYEGASLEFQRGCIYIPIQTSCAFHW